MSDCVLFLRLFFIFLHENLEISKKNIIFVPKK